LEVCMRDVIISLDCMSIIILLTILYGASMDKQKKDRKAKIFIMLTVLGIVGTLADVASFAMVGNPRNDGIVGILNCVTLIVAVWFGECYSRYIIAYVSPKRRIPIVYMIIPHVWGAFAIVSIIIGYITGVFFYMDNGEYITGSHYYVCMGYIILLVLYSAFLVIRYFKEIGSRYAISLLTYVIAPIVTAIIEVVIPGLALSYVGLAFATMVLYMFIQGVEINNSRVNEEAARQIAKEKSDFLAKFSHELRSPINAVIGLDEMIMRTSDNDEVVNYARGVQSASKTLLGIINDILDSSKLEAGKIELLETEYETMTMINDLVNMVSIRLESKNIGFELEVDPNLPVKLYGDDIKIKQIITNLLTNAVKYTNQGSINLKITFEKESENEIVLKVFVKDTGIGIKEEEIHKLFKPFERIDENRNRNVEGTGLGMFITQGFLSLMNSKLEVESEYGKGSCFSFALKQKVTDWTAIGEFNEAVERMHTKKYTYQALFTAPEANILIVDDTRINLLVCKKLLKDTLVKCECAESGREAVELCRNKTYDVILMDHMMPEMDGLEAMQHIKTDEESVNKHTAVVVLTANATTGDRETFIEMGFDDYVSKPIDYKCLEETLYRLLPKDKVNVKL